MAACETIIGLKLDSKSKAALERISKKKELANFLATALSVGVFSNIFTKNNTPTAAYNVTQTDWLLYAQAMRGIPEITRVVIRKEAELMQFDYMMSNDRGLQQFWKGIANGCQ